MKTLKEKAIMRTAQAIKFLDSFVLLSEELEVGAIEHRKARRILFGILEDNGYYLSQNYKPIKHEQ